MSENTPASHPVAGTSAILADRYVSALFALSEQDGVIDDIVADMANLRQLWTDSAEWRFIASDPRLSLDVVRKVAAEVAKLAEVSKLTANFLSIIAQNRRLSLLPMVIERFVAEVSARRGEYIADVRTARPLSEEQRDKLTSLLAAATGGKIRLAVIEDPSIIGGLTVKVGSQFVDASVKTKLDRMERTLKETSAAA